MLIERPGRQPMEQRLSDRVVDLEILRAGPSHNQLLSPLTQYLAVCGDASAIVLNIPWEHAAFERRLKSLRYDHGTDRDHGRRRLLLEEMGHDIAKLFGGIPALFGLLYSGRPTEPREVKHLRLVISASELALIPYELCKIGPGVALPGEGWLLLQPQIPVSLTRHVRSVPPARLRPSDDMRVLLVASDPRDLPFDGHREALLDAVDPWLLPDQRERPQTALPGVEFDGDLEVYGDRLTIISNASIEDVDALCEERVYTHVHVLAHGVEGESWDHRSFGIRLRERRAKGQAAVVSGERFAQALITTVDGEVSLPFSVSLASCDSANVGSVIRAGASFAHAVHEAGVPLVIASQFPLSFAGSELMVRRIFASDKGILRCTTHPVTMLHALRRDLMVETGQDTHDWASLVVYESLPARFEDQLDLLHYHRSKAVLSVARRHLAALPGVPVVDLEAALGRARDRTRRARSWLPSHGPFHMEAIGLEASSLKAGAEACFRAALRFEASCPAHARLLDQSVAELEDAMNAYQRAVNGFLGYRLDDMQRQATLHWVVVQMLSMGAALGETLDLDHFGVGRRSAFAHLAAPVKDERAWAHGSLAELALLRLASEDVSDRAGVSADAIRHIESLIELYPERGAPQIESTREQFRRYVDWWSDEVFVSHLKRSGIERPIDWSLPHGVRDTAERIVELLSQRLEPRAAIARADAPQGRPASPVSDESVSFNGINGSTGRSLTSSTSARELCDLARSWVPDRRNLVDLEERRARSIMRRGAWLGQRPVDMLRPRYGVDPSRLEEARWGVVFAHGDRDESAIREALAPLIELRTQQTDGGTTLFVGADAYRPGEAYLDFLSRHGMGPGPADPTRVPYYLLLVGSPQQIPFEFQYGLSVQYAVGRLHFERIEDYARYASSVVAAESGDTSRRRTVELFGVSHPDDEATRLSSSELVAPLADALAHEQSGWRISTRLGDGATKANLARVFEGAGRPALLLTASHGMTFELDDPRLLSHGGALLCHDWSGNRGQRVPESAYFSGDDLRDDADVGGLIAFFFACYGAGTPAHDSFARDPVGSTRIAPQDFLARLPARLLAHPRGGALAVVGHVDRAYSCSFRWKRSGQQIQVFDDMLRALMDGHRIGHAMERFNERYAELSTALAERLRHTQPGDELAEPWELAGMWTAASDARSYVILGDPAVKLALEG